MILNAHALNAIALSSPGSAVLFRNPQSDVDVRVVKFRARMDIPTQPPGMFEVEFPISSFNGRLNADGITYLACVVPQPEPYWYEIDFISSHDGRLYIVRDAYDGEGDLLVSGDIAWADIDALRLDTGSSSSSATIEARGITAVGGYPFVIPLRGASYHNLTDGRKRYRLAPQHDLKPGDHVSVDGDEFDIGDISYYVNTTQAVMEIAEAEA